MVRQKVMSGPAVLLLAVTCCGHHQPRSLSGPQHLSPCSCVSFRIFPHFQDVSSNQYLHLLLSKFLSSYEDYFIYEIILFHQLLFSEPQALHFPNLNNLYVEAQCVSSFPCLMSLLTGGFGTCHFCLDLVFSNFTSSLYHLQVVSSRLCLAVQRFNFRHSPLHTAVMFTV